MEEAFFNQIDSAVSKLSNRLVAKKNGACWRGHLSSSALATAVASSALMLRGNEQAARGGIKWLKENQNSDGGWGDTPESPSNISTTILAMAAFKIVDDEINIPAQNYVNKETGGATIPQALKNIYGDDLTFAVPIMVNCALAKMVEWKEIPALPFELSLAPRSLFALLNMRVVSYALPALIAIGRAVFKNKCPLNPLTFLLRKIAWSRSVKILRKIQPSSGGYLEAAPLTAFVLMSLHATGDGDNEVAKECEKFLVASIREDGSLPIDSDLAMWLTGQAVIALNDSGSAENFDESIEWIHARQFEKVHEYTGATPGGWAWTDLPGGVPDADDTAGALLALAVKPDKADKKAVAAGVKWLKDIQNSDGGWPTFCKGWQDLPFDKSSPELTAHAIRALHAWHKCLSLEVAKGLEYLRNIQNEDGSWIPLWFGNQANPDKTNPVYATSRVLEAYGQLFEILDEIYIESAKNGAQYLLDSQNADGGWGGAKGISSTTEETAVALTGLCAIYNVEENIPKACRKAANFLIDATESEQTKSSPIGLYFAALWYDEELYPIIWSLKALAKYRDSLVK